MTASSPPAGSTTLRDQLIADHHDLERVIRQLLVGFDKGIPEDLVVSWNRFETTLVRHMSVEERFVLPHFERAHATVAMEIRADHVEFRQRLAEMRSDLRLHFGRLPSARRFLGRLEAHSAREDRVLYSWLSSHRGGIDGDALLRALDRPAPSIRLRATSDGES